MSPFNILFTTVQLNDNNKFKSELICCLQRTSVLSLTKCRHNIPITLSRHWNWPFIDQSFTKERGEENEK